MSTYNGITYGSAPPAGITPNPDAPYSAASLIAVSAIFFPLAVIVTSIRIYSRARLVGQVSVDDYLMIGAAVCNAVMMGCIFDMLNWGLGKHMWDVPLTPDLFPKFSIDNLTAAIFFCAATGLAKSSILLFYLRIFPNVTIRWLVWILFAFTIGYSLASVLVNIFSCNPISGSWDLQDAAITVCIDRPVFYFAQAGLGIFTDIATVVVPLPALRALRLPAKQKVGVAVLLTMGAFVCVVSMVRLQSLYILLEETDLTRNTVVALMWCILELNLSIIAGSVPAAKSFIQKLFPGILGSTAGVGSGYIRSTDPFESNKASRIPGSSSRVTERSFHVTTSIMAASGSEEYIMQHPEHTDKITMTVDYGFDVELQPRGTPTVVAKRLRAE